MTFHHLSKESFCVREQRLSIFKSAWALVGVVYIMFIAQTHYNIFVFAPISFAVFFWFTLTMLNSSHINDVKLETLNEAMRKCKDEMVPCDISPMNRPKINWPSENSDQKTLYMNVGRAKAGQTKSCMMLKCLLLDLHWNIIWYLCSRDSMCCTQVSKKLYLQLSLAATIPALIVNKWSTNSTTNDVYLALELPTFRCARLHSVSKSITINFDWKGRAQFFVIKLSHRPNTLGRPENLQDNFSKPHGKFSFCMFNLTIGCFCVVNNSVYVYRQ